jgi:hypothetical protein
MKGIISASPLLKDAPVIHTTWSLSDFMKILWPNLSNLHYQFKKAIRE